MLLLPQRRLRGMRMPVRDITNRSRPDRQVRLGLSRLLLIPRLRLRGRRTDMHINRTLIPHTLPLCPLQCLQRKPPLHRPLLPRPTLHRRPLHRHPLPSNQLPNLPHNPQTHPQQHPPPQCPSPPNQYPSSSPYHHSPLSPHSASYPCTPHTPNNSLVRSLLS